MKKILSIVALVAISLVQAQDFKSKRGEYMLPEKGDWALGFSTDGIFQYLGNAFNGNVGNNAPTVEFSNTVDNGFRGRFVGKYFTSDKSAYRVVFNFRSQGSGQKFASNTANNTVVTVPSTPAPNVVTNTILETEQKNSTTEFSIGVGKEWRRGKTRLQGFYGVDALLFVSTASGINNRYEETLTTVTTPAQTIKVIDQRDVDNKPGTSFGIGAEGFIGAEYFIFPKMAIGAQYTYGLNYISQGAGTTTTVQTNSTANSTASPSFVSNVETDVDDSPKAYLRGFTGVGIVSINLTLHF